MISIHYELLELLNSLSRFFGDLCLFSKQFLRIFRISCIAE